MWTGDLKNLTQAPATDGSRSEAPAPTWTAGLQRYGDTAAQARLMTLNAAARSLGAILQRSSDSMEAMLKREIGAAMQGDESPFTKALTEAKQTILLKVRTGQA